MEEFLIGIILLLIILNLVVLYLFMRSTRNHQEIDSNAIHQSIEQFVTQLEQENDEFYQKLVMYIKEKEVVIQERIHALEERLDGAENNTPIAEEPLSISNEIKHVSKLENSDGYENIVKLHKQGFTTKQIAKVLQIELGEVELVVNVYKKQNLLKS